MEAGLSTLSKKFVRFNCLLQGRLRLRMAISIFHKHRTVEFREIANTFFQLFNDWAF